MAIMEKARLEIMAINTKETKNSEHKENDYNS